jgi:hypothetical protein
MTETPVKIPWIQLVVGPLFIIAFLAWFAALRAWFDNVWDDKITSDKDIANIVYAIFLTFLIGLAIYWLAQFHKQGYM